MATDGWKKLSDDLSSALGLQAPPIAITFSDAVPAGIDTYDEPMPDAAADGRTGRVPAGCVFWMRAVDRTFATSPADHRNCSVGSLTHGLVKLEEAAGNEDVAAIMEAGWVTQDMVPQIPTVSRRHESITYGPLADTPIDPDVVLLRINGSQMMTISEAVPELKLGGKPQCHIVAVAKEDNDVAASLGCALSRVRTGMPADEMTCTIPGTRVQEVVDRLHKALEVQRTVQGYARNDAARFGA